MITYHADDYGINKVQSKRILLCSERHGGVLNSVSIMPNSKHLDETVSMIPQGIKMGIHINLAEGEPCASLEQIPLLIKNGVFYHSFVSLLCLTLIKRRTIEEQLVKEILSQIKSVTLRMNDNYKIRIDSHVHYHMIPLVFKAMCKALSQSEYDVEYIRYPVEHFSFYFQTPSVWKHITPVNIIKAFLLSFFGIINYRTLRKYGYESCIGNFYGVMFTSKMYGKHIIGILRKYISDSGQSGRDLEVLFHPGGIHEGEEYLKGCNAEFKAVYSSVSRDQEAEMLRKLGRIK